MYGIFNRVYRVSSSLIIFSDTLIFFLAGPGQKARVLCMLLYLNKFKLVQYRKIYILWVLLKFKR